MPETVWNPITHEFSRKFGKKLSKYIGRAHLCSFVCYTRLITALQINELPNVIQKSENCEYKTGLTKMLKGILFYYTVARSRK
jgi:hypothetical protein